ncbi:MAG: hypothetical protein WC044_01700 [Crocinitomicaceae bacterium]
MSTTFYKTLLIAFVAIALPLFIFPINLFEGEIVYQIGIQHSVIKAPLSLSYFIGLGYDPADMVNIKSFYLLPFGYAMVAVFLIGIPVLIAYRVHLGKLKNKQHEKN